MLDLQLRLGKQPREVYEQAPGDDDGAFDVDLCVERCSQGELHVGRREVQLSAFGAQQHAGEDLHRAPRRDGARDDGEPGHEVLLGCT